MNASLPSIYIAELKVNPCGDACRSLTFRLLMSYIYGAPILDVSRSHTTTQHSQ